MTKRELTPTPIQQATESATATDSADHGLEFADYGSKSLTAIEAAVTKAKAYTP